MKFVDLSCNEIRRMRVEDVFEYEGGSWRSYYRNIVENDFCNDVDFEYDEIDRSVFIWEDGGEMFRLKDGSWINVCWRGVCRVWREEEENNVIYDMLVKTGDFEVLEDLV